MILLRSCGQAEQGSIERNRPSLPRQVLTAGSDEVRAWTFKAGSKAPQCAGVIHSDFERGFIRAEVIKYEDYIALGGESACRQAGKLGIEGKEYIVQDGDIMHFLFNV